MKLTFQKAALLNGINIVLKAVPSKTTMPILECILIDASTNEIKLTGNDMELGIETKVEGEILERGKIALDAKLFSEIVRKLADADATVTICHSRTKEIEQYIIDSCRKSYTDPATNEEIILKLLSLNNFHNEIFLLSLY